MADIVNFVIDAGSDFSVTKQIRYANNQIVDLLNFDLFLGGFRKTYTWGNTIPITVTAGANGNITLTIEAAKTVNIDPIDYVYDVEAFNLINKMKLLEGYIKIKPTVFKPF